MNIQYDVQLLLDIQKTGIGNTAQKTIEHVVKTNKDYNFMLNYFSPFHTSRNRSLLGQVIKLGCKTNECRWFHSTVYKLLYNFIPVPYSLFFGSNADITHFMNYYVPPGVKGRVVTMVYDMVYCAFPETMNYKTRYMLNMSMMRSCRRANKIITISQFSKNEIMKYLNIPSEKIVIMPCGVDNSVYNPDYGVDEILEVKNKLKIEGDYYLYLGTLEPRKNVERLIDAYILLKRRIKDAPKLVLAGRKGWLYDTIFQKISLSGIENDVLFTGYVDQADSPVLMKGALAFLFPSIYEGFGMPPLEAMSCGTPVITSNLSSLPEVVGDAALLVDPYSIESIADAMDRVLTDTDLHRLLSQKGIKQAASFTWERSAEIVSNTYKSLI